MKKEQWVFNDVSEVLAASVIRAIALIMDEASTCGTQASNRLHSTTQKTTIFIFTAVRTQSDQFISRVLLFRESTNLVGPTTDPRIGTKCSRETEFQNYL